MGNPKTRAETPINFTLLFLELGTENGKNNTAISKNLGGGFVTLNYDVY